LADDQNQQQQAAAATGLRQRTSIVAANRRERESGGSAAEKIALLSGGGESSSSSPSSFSLSKLRRTAFPIYGRQEVTKFVLMGAIKFAIILALTLTRDTKDTLVVTQCGAEAIAFLKIYGVLPAAAAFIALYSELSNKLPKSTLFYVTCVPFFLFFAAFDAFLYPNRDLLHPSLKSVRAWLLPAAAVAAGDAQGEGGGLAIVAKIIANWTSALFYVVSEIYSSVSVGLLFWQYANDVVPVDQAKRFYPLFAQMSGLAPIVAGQYVVRYASKAPDFDASMRRLTAAVTAAGVMICAFYKLSTSYIARTEGKSIDDDDNVPGGDDASSTKKTAKKKKEKMSMVESAKFLARSQYLRLIATLVLGYGYVVRTDATFNLVLQQHSLRLTFFDLCRRRVHNLSSLVYRLSINFTEILWKSLVKKQYPDPLDYQRFMGNFSSAVGVSTFVVIFFGVHVIRLLGWKVGAMATPAIMAGLAVPFFSCILMGLDSPARLSIAVLFGTIQSLLSKTAKYALFDPTTQMAYIPLDDESKVKGKAAIDVLGSRIGKSGGSLIQQGLVFVFGNMINAAPVVAVIYYTVLLLWMNAANTLSGLFRAKTEMDKADKLEAKEKNKKSKSQQ